MLPIGGGVGQRSFMIEHAAKIPAIDPAATGFAFDEMLRLVRWRAADPLANILAARDVFAKAFRASPAR